MMPHSPSKSSLAALVHIFYAIYYFCGSLGFLTGPDNALGQEDRDALQNVLPSSQLFDSSYSFYLYMATLFKSNSLQHYEVHFTQLALSVAPSNTDTSFLWHTVVRGYIDLGLFEEAYAAWISTPSDTQ